MLSIFFRLYDIFSLIELRCLIRNVTFQLSCNSKASRVVWFIGGQLVLVAALSLIFSSPPKIAFRDVGAATGLDFHHVSGSLEKKYLLEAMSGGVAWIDYNRDHWPDLFLVNGGSWEGLATGRRGASNALFRNNRDGTFLDVTADARVQGDHWGMGAAVGDYDNDGWPDLYVCNYGANTLYHNNGDGTFTDGTAKAGVGDELWSSSAAFGDYDGDGWLDLYVANYLEFDHRRPPASDCRYRGIVIPCGPQGLVPAPDTLYRNQRDGTFREVTRRTGVAAHPSFGLGVIWWDFDNDGDLDIYVANDSLANFLFVNQGDGKFRETGVAAGVAFNEDGKEQASMGIALGDYNRDGALDLYVTNFSDDYNALYRNLGNGLFRDSSYFAEVVFPAWNFLGWGTFFFDYDNDGWEDLFVANGHLYPQLDRYQMDVTYAQRKHLFRNRRDGKFEDVAESLGEALAEPQSSRGAAAADFDNDGDLDIAVNNLGSRPSLLQNDLSNGQNSWVSLSLEGAGRTNRSAIGARVSIETAGERQMQEVTGGASYQSSHDLRLHFGLGPATTIDLLAVRWTDGTVQTFRAVTSNRFYGLVQGKALEAIQP